MVYIENFGKLKRCPDKKYIMEVKKSTNTFRWLSQKRVATTFWNKERISTFFMKTHRWQPFLWNDLSPRACSSIHVSSTVFQRCRCPVEKLQNVLGTNHTILFSIFCEQSQHPHSARLVQKYFGTVHWRFSSILTYFQSSSVLSLNTK